VRFIDADMASLDLQQLRFRHATLQETGPRHATRVRSRRQLELKAQRNVEVMWLLERLAPAFPVPGPPARPSPMFPGSTPGRPHC
jgi:hypothetical protein